MPQFDDDEIVWDEPNPQSPGDDEITWDEPEESGSILRRGTDVAVSGVKGIFGLGMASKGLFDIATGGVGQKLLDVAAVPAGQRPTGEDRFDSEKINQGIEQFYSRPQQEANRKVQAAEGFLGTAGAMVQNPSTIFHSAVESLPAMYAGGKIGQAVLGAGIKAPAALSRLMGAGSEKAGVLMASAIGEGTVGAGMAADTITNADPDRELSVGQTAAAIGSGVGTGLFNLVGGRVAARYGLGDIDTMFTRGIIGKSRQGIAKRLIGGGISEGLIEEMPQSAQEQLWINAATGKPLTEGLPESMAQGLLVGALMGSGSNILAKKSDTDDTDLLNPDDPGREARQKEKFFGDIFNRLESGEWTLAEVQAIHDNLDQGDPRKQDLADIFFEYFPQREAPTATAPRGEGAGDMLATEKAQTRGIEVAENWQAAQTDPSQLPPRGVPAGLEVVPSNTIRMDMPGRLLGRAEDVEGIQWDDQPDQLALPPGIDRRALPPGQGFQMSDGPKGFDLVPSRTIQMPYDEVSPRPGTATPAATMPAARGADPVSPPIRPTAAGILVSPEVKTLPPGESLPAQGIQTPDIKVLPQGQKIEGPAKKNAQDLSLIAESAIVAFPDIMESEGGLLPLNRFTPDEQQTLRNAGIVETATTSNGNTYEGVNSEYLWQRRKQIQDQRSANKNAEKVSIDTKANEAATSPLNDLPEPTEAQKEAGNYKLGKIKVHGLDVSIENPEGSTRSGVSEDGKPWSTTMSRAHYGYFRQSESKDGDPVDVFVAPGKSDKVYVIDQVNPKTGKFDEPKVVTGAQSEQEAREIYLSNYEEGWQGLGAITEMPVLKFKKWINSGVKSRPVGKLASAIPEQRTDYDKTYPKASDTVDGRKVRSEVPNTGSISASLNDYTELPGIREVNLDMFEAPPEVTPRTKALAEEIRASGEVNPLIVVVDAQGPYILEGGHRYDAMKILGAKSIPAMVVIDNESIGDTAPKAESAAKPPATAKTEPTSDQPTKQEDLGPIGKFNTPALAKMFHGLIKSGQMPANKIEIQGAVAKALGMKRSDLLNHPDWSHKPVEEAFEYAIVQRAREIIRETKGIQETYLELERLYQAMPNLATRNSTSMTNQAYSTPVHLGYLMQMFARVNDTKSVYEPTAGTGMLLTAAEPAMAWANEIDMTRFGILKDQNFLLSRIDGQEAVGHREPITKPYNKGPQPKAFDVVVSNPPFGSIPVKTFDGYKISKLEHAIVIDALKAMKDDGRAALIIGGEHVNDNGEANINQQVFMNYLHHFYNVVANVEIPGALYAKQGAKFPVRMILINGRKKTPGGNAPSPEGADIGEYIKGKRLPYYSRVSSIGQIADLIKEAGHGQNALDSLGIKEVPDSEKSAGGDGTRDTGRPSIPGSASGKGDRPDQKGQGPGTDSDLSESSPEPTQRPQRPGTGLPGSGRPESDLAPTSSRPDNVPEGQKEGRPSGDIQPDEPGKRKRPQDTDLQGGTGKPDAGRVPRTGDITAELSDLDEGGLDALLSGVAADMDGQVVESPPRSEMGKGAPQIVETQHKIPTKENATKTPGEVLKQSGIESLGAIKSGLKGLDALFGGSRLNMGMTFDEDTYAKAKPYFSDMWDHAKKAGYELKQFVKLIFERYGTRVQPYLKKFLMELQQETDAPPKKSNPVSQESEETDYQTVYSPKSKGPIIDTTLIPRRMKEAVEGALSRLEGKVGDIDAFVAEKLEYKNTAALHKAMSADQIDAVALAIDNIENGSGMVIGDQTGVGKGRIAAALWKYARLRSKKPVFFTAKPQLFTDYYRDITDIGYHFNPMLMASKQEEGSIVDKSGRPVQKVLGPGPRTSIYRDMRDRGAEGLGEHDGVLTTYSQINQVRLQQEALRPMFPGNIVILDEAHKAAGPDSETGNFIRNALQNVDGVVYLSATFAKRPDTMPLYFKTDMSRANLSMEDLISAVENGDTPLQEILSSDLAKVGQYVRREKSFKGISVNTITDTKNRTRDEARSDAMTSIMRDVLSIDKDIAEAFSKAVKKAKKQGAQYVWGVPIPGSIKVEGSNLSSTVSRSNFAATAHNAVRQLLLAMKVDVVVDKAIEALSERSKIEAQGNGKYSIIDQNGNVVAKDLDKETADMTVAPQGRKVFIALDNTMGSFVNYMLEDGDIGIGEPFKISFGAVLKRNLDRTMQVTVTDPTGAERKYDIDPRQLPPNLSAKYYDAIDKIENDVADIPGSPIDAITEKLMRAGYRVGEITGRDYVADYSDMNRITLRKRTAQEKDAKKEILKSYNDGAIDVILVNRSAAEGVSAHASTSTGKDLRPRSFIGAQAQLNVDDEVQLMGRVNRKGQVMLPTYNQVFLDIPAELRPAAVLMRKLKSLSANTSANSDSPLSQKTLPDMDNKYGNKVVAQWLAENALVRNSLGLGTDDDFMKVSGKIAMMPIDVQRSFFEDVELEYNLLIQDMKEQGLYDLEVQELDYKAKEIEKVVTNAGRDESNPFGASTYREKLSVKSPGKPFNKERIKRMVEERLDGKTPRQIQREFLDQLEKETLAYAAERRRAAEAEGQTFDDANLMAAQDFIGHAIGRAEIGNTYRLQVEGLPTMTGVLLGYKRAKGRGNPAAGSRTRLEFAVNNSLRKLNITASKLEKGEASFGYASQGIINNWDSLISGDMRQQIYMITGNLLQGFANVPPGSKIVRFTMNDGTMREGIQLPLGYNPAEAGDTVQVTPEQAFAVLMGGTPLRGTTVAITTGKDILVPPSRMAGGRFFLDETLRQYVERGEFETRGEHMRATIIPGRERVAIERIYELGDSFAVPRSAYSDEGDQKLSTKTEGQRSVSPRQVEKAFQSKGFTTERLGNLIRVKTSSGNLYIDVTDMVVQDDEAAIKIGYGRSAQPGEKVAGSYQNFEGTGTIRLKRNLADEYTLDHETYHHLKAAGVLTSMELAVVRKAAGADEEAQARWIEGKLRDRGNTKGIVNRMLQKVADWLDAFANLFAVTERGLLRGMESGKFLDRESYLGDVAPQVEGDYSTTAARWFSQMQQVLEKKLPGSGNPKLIRNMLKAWADKGEYKAEELEWSGLTQWLDSQSGKITKAQVVDYLAANNVQVEEVEKSEQIGFEGWEREDLEAEYYNYFSVGASGFETDPSRMSDQQLKDALAKEGVVDGSTKFSNWQLPGGENYRELLLTLPEKDKVVRKPSRSPQGWGDTEGGDMGFEETGNTGADFRSSHWSEPNVLAHVRFNERTGPNGERILLIEEIQSDWHQRGRREGYKVADTKIKYQSNGLPEGWTITENKQAASWQPRFYVRRTDGAAYAGGETINAAIEKAKSLPDFEKTAHAEQIGFDKVPDAPFKKTWPMLAFKRMVRYAAENGFDSISWTPGDVQAERYDLSKQVDELRYSESISYPGAYTIVGIKDGREIINQNGIAKDALENYVGKEVAQKIEAGEGSERTGNGGVKQKTLSGLDLKVGGKGMAGFYDKILPAEVNRFFGKAAWGGAKVETGDVLTGEEQKTVKAVTESGKTIYLSQDQDGSWWAYENGGMPIGDDGFDTYQKAAAANNATVTTKPKSLKAWSLPITPQMRQKALREGMPLFSTLTPKEQGGHKANLRREETEALKNVMDFLNQYKKAAVTTAKASMPGNLPHLSFMEQILKSPEWYEHPIMKKIVRFGIDRHDRFYEHFNEINEAADTSIPYETVTEATKALKIKGMTRLQRIAGKSSKDYQQLQEMVDYGDTNGREFEGKTLDERLQKFEDHFREKGFSEDAIKVWRLHRKAYDSALDKLLAPMRELRDNLEEKAAFGGLTENAMNKFMSMRNDDGAKEWLSLKDVISEMETWRGFYAPRIRDAGKWVVKGYKGTSPYSSQKEYFRYHRTTRMGAEKLAEELKGKGYTVSPVEENTALGEDVLQHVKTMATAELLDKAAENISQGGGVNAETALRFHDELVTQVADLIRARGFRSTMIHRKEGNVVRGYIEDPAERMVRYITNTAAGLAKAETAAKMTETLFGKFVDGERVGGIQPDKEPRAYGVAQQYIMEQLRNADGTDRIVGMAKALTTFKYLGFNPKSVFVNTTSMVTTVPAALRQYATDGTASISRSLSEIAKAGKDYAYFMKSGKRGGLSVAEHAFLLEAQRNGYDDPQYTRDSIGLIRSMHGKAFSQAMEWSMKLFGATEKWNRGSTMLAAYRMAEGGETVRKEKARLVIEKAHGVYGRATLPSWAQGSNPAAKVGQMLYVYQKFGHNWLQMLYDLGFKKKDMKSFAWALGAPVVIGGAAAIPMKSAMVAILQAVFAGLLDDRDLENVVWDGVRKNLGETAEVGLRYGLSGLAGVDVSGSLSFDPTLSADVKDYTGAIGGMIGDVSNAGRYLFRGQPGKAAESVLPTVAANPLRAYREAKEGATTMRGNRIFDERGKPYMPSGVETGAKALGFRSARRATVQARSWENKSQLNNFKDRRQAINEEYKAYLASRDPDAKQEVLDKIRQYNNDLKKHRLGGTISPITGTSLRQVARNMARPRKNERLND